MSPSGSSTLSGGGSCIGSGAGPDDGTTNRSTRRTGRRAGRSKMRLNKTPIGRLSSKPPSLTQCGRVRLVNGAIAGRAGTSPFLAVPFVNGRKEGSNASGNEAELRAASASAGAVSGRARSVSVKVNRPRRSTSWTRVPNESVNLLVSPASSVVVMYRVVDGVRAASGRSWAGTARSPAWEAAWPERRICVRRRTRGTVFSCPADLGEARSRPQDRARGRGSRPGQTR